MPVIAQWILAGLAWALTSAVGKIMTTLGLAFVVSEFVVPDWIDWLSGLAGGTPAFVLDMLGMFRVDDAITVIMSALGVRAATGTVTGLRRGAATGGGGP